MIIMFLSHIRIKCNGNNVSYFNAFLVLVFLNEDSSNTIINHSISIFLSVWAHTDSAE